MPIIKKGVSMPDTDDYVWDIYDQSLKMSTYLLGKILTFDLLRLIIKIYSMELSVLRTKILICSRKNK